MKTKTKNRAQMYKIVDHWPLSGLSREEYCVEHNYNQRSFKNWTYKARDYNLSKARDNAQLSSIVAFVPLQIEDAPTGVDQPRFELHYPNGDRLEMSSLPSTEDLRSRIQDHNIQKQDELLAYKGKQEKNRNK